MKMMVIADMQQIRLIRNKIYGGKEVNKRVGKEKHKLIFRSPKDIKKQQKSTIYDHNNHFLSSFRNTLFFQERASGRKSVAFGG